MRRFLLSGVALLALGGVAEANIVLGSGSAITSAGAAAPPGTGAAGGAPTDFGPGGPVGGLSDGSGNAVPLINFIVPFAGNVTVSINDCCLVGDVYQTAVDGLFLGQTSSQPISGATNSTGSFTLALLAGLHTLGIEDIVLSYEGNPSPFGGNVPAGGPGTGNSYDPAGLTYSIVEITAGVPEPMTLAMLGAGLVGLGAVRRRRKK